MSRQLITVQVFVNADPAEAENVAARAADYITESFTQDQRAVTQTCIVAGAPFRPTLRGTWDGVQHDGTDS